MELLAILLPAVAIAHSRDFPASLKCTTHQQFCSAIARYAEQLRLPGYALAVARDGRIIHLQTAGFADIEHGTPIRANSIFPIASITKTFTAALMMRYAETGRIHLDDHLTDYPQLDDPTIWPYSSSEIRIRHVLSQTSEGATPGEVFTYNGNRFNYVYGVFAKLSGEQDYPLAFAHELHTQILDPLGLTDTLTGFPDAKDDALAARVVTPYRYDAQRGTFIADDDLRSGHRHAYPNSGVLSTLSDLVRYVDSLDRDELMHAASAAEMTTPFRLNRGVSSPYGLGWFSEEWNGMKFSWVYGLGPSYASFLLHVPSEKITFVFLANNDAPTAALRLNYGDALQFPPAASFLRNFTTAGKTIPHIDLSTDVHALESSVARRSSAERRAAFVQLTGVALTKRYMEKAFGGPTGHALAIATMMYHADPGYFRSVCPELIALIYEISDASLLDAMNDLGAAYTANYPIDPRISQDLGDFYDHVGIDAQSIRYRAALVAAPGYETNDATIASAFALGDQYFRRGDTAMGRHYYWIGLRDATMAGRSSNFAKTKQQHMNELVRASVDLSEEKGR
jgi:CubicO group peptidase (beta-lactamase class C family)